MLGSSYCTKTILAQHENSFVNDDLEIVVVGADAVALYPRLSDVEIAIL